MSRLAIIVGVLATAVVLSAAAILLPLPAVAPGSLETPLPLGTPPVDTGTTTTAPPATVPLTAQDIPGAAPQFTFVAQLPSGWKSEAVAGSQAISLYDPAATGESTLDQSQIFIRFFTADRFLTLPSVTIHHQESLTINGRPAVRYDIEKQASAPIFPAQPTWRNRRHMVTDIRVSDANPSVFYVIAQRPDLAETTYQDFLNSLRTATEDNLVLPIAEFHQRITKKPFGIFITPENSPVQPERFSGYHTGVDVEYDDVSGEVTVQAIADGTVLSAQRASGYGGVVAIQHKINGQTTIAIYGHLDPASLVKANATVKAGQQLGILGEGDSPETDGERKHLHFALIPGTALDRRGYVANEEELKRWRDPLTLFPKSN